VRRRSGAARASYLPRYTGPVPPADPSPAAVARWLKEAARSRGFDLAGITTPDPPPHLEVYAAWLRAGRHGEMGYLATERARAARADPRLLLPECRSILVLGANYTPQGEPKRAPARVAAYARGDDYHQVLAARARTLLDDLRSSFGAGIAGRVYTDTGPLLERELAQRAGLGWIGRNTCLIHPRLGSMILLVEVLLGIEIPADEAFAADRCGACRRCLAACPTGCILPDRTLDATRCISYLTIEGRDAIPDALRGSVGEWLFGCDVCQSVCPWNSRFGQPTSDPAFAPRVSLAAPDPADWLALSQQEFSARLRGSPLKRARRDGLARNAAVVAGNLRRRADVSALAGALLEDPSPIVRAHAAWALGRIGSEPARHWLRQAHTLELEVDVRTEITAALS